jgi:hypothetical protein
MRPPDRLVVRSGPGNRPGIAGLEWRYAVNDLWIGRLPKAGGPSPKAAP